MPHMTGYMDKERADTAERRKEYMGWLKSAQEGSRKFHANFQTHMDKLATETRERHKKFEGANRQYAKTLGRFDECRKEVREFKYS